MTTMNVLPVGVWVVAGYNDNADYGVVCAADGQYPLVSWYGSLTRTTCEVGLDVEVCDDRDHAERVCRARQVGHAECLWCLHQRDLRTVTLDDLAPVGVCRDCDCARREVAK